MSGLLVFPGVLVSHDLTFQADEAKVNTVTDWASFSIGAKLVLEG
jgi:hypothetical protein